MTKSALQEAGIAADKIVKIIHPVAALDTPPKSNEIAAKLNRQKGDVIYCTVGMPVIGYPTRGFRELAAGAAGAIVLADTFSYYELARELQRIDRPKQAELSKKYAAKAAWPRLAKDLVAVYKRLS